MLASPVRGWKKQDVYSGLSDIEFIANKPERLRVLSGDPTGYGAATSRVFAIYENFPGKIMSVLLEHNYLFFLISNP
ncbi:hypothetical protein RCM31_17025 [Escherichia coli]|uniref:hypothetical protein n=2 Tax=Escherichia TaxID=561 RepID=UPI0012FFDC50|nr:hypothetical protein [Escherichia coli]MED9072935.1 hypothetical protein [Escherichia coli]